MIKTVFAAAAAALLTGAAQAAVFVSVEAGGAQNTTVAFPTAVETFDNQALGNVVPVNTSFAALGVSAVFTSTSILGADIYGGAGGTGNFVAVRNTGDLEISFDKVLTYFGVWASALDANNTVVFYKDGNVVDTVNLTVYGAGLGGSYNGNPTTAFLGQNGAEKYAFFNFGVMGGYDKAVLSQNGGGGFELDNVTIGGVIPEPATWALMIGGFFMVGLNVRRRKALAA